MLNRAHKNSRVWKHYNSFYREPGIVDVINCEVCGSICDVTRGVSGHTSWGGVMTKSKINHDHFICPHNDEEWHWETLAMVQEFNDTSSPSLRKLIQKDIDEAKKENIFIEHIR